MAWNNPLPTFADGGTPTAAQLNQYLDNLEWLHAPPKGYYEEPGTTTMTTSGTTWGTINANFATTIVTTGADVFALFCGAINRLEIDISVDGTRYAGTGTSGTGSIRSESSLYNTTMNLPILYDNISAGTHTFAVQWRHTGGASGAIVEAYQTRFYVRELS